MLTAESRDVYLLGAAVAQCNCCMERSERSASVQTQKTRKKRGCDSARHVGGAAKCALTGKFALVLHDTVCIDCDGMIPFSFRKESTAYTVAMTENPL